MAYWLSTWFCVSKMLVASSKLGLRAAWQLQQQLAHLERAQEEELLAAKVAGDTGLYMCISSTSFYSPWAGSRPRCHAKSCTVCVVKVFIVFGNRT